MLLFATDLESVFLIRRIRECEKLQHAPQDFFLCDPAFYPLLVLHTFYILCVNVYAFFKCFSTPCG